MSTSSRIYFLFDAASGSSFEDLNFDQVRSLLGDFPVSSFNDMHAWYDGLADWVPLEEVGELAALLQEIRSTRARRPPPFPKSKLRSAAPVIANDGAVAASAPQPLSESVAEAAPKVQAKPRPEAQLKAAPEPVTTPEPMAAPKPVVASQPVLDQAPKKEFVERRAHPRDPHAFKVLIVHEGVCFKTSGLCDSLNGMELRHQVPEDFVGKVCVAHIAQTSGLDKRQLKFKVRLIVNEGEGAHRLAFVDPDAACLSNLSAWIEATKRLPQVA